MNKLNGEDIKGFLFDSIGVTVAFLLNSFLIIIFYYLTTKGVSDVIYPIIISFTIYIFYMLIRGIGYFKFIKSLKQIENTLNFNESTSSYNEKMVYSTLNSQFENHMKEISDLNLKMKHFKSFFSQWIHDMKTPISVIELIIQNNDYEDIAQLKKELKEENTRLLDNLDKALSFVRLDEFSKDYLPEAVNLKGELIKVINKKKRQFIYNRISPKIICDDDNINIVTDIKWNEFIIEQLTNNAIKYSKDGEKGKNIYYIISKYGKGVTLTVRDEGMGISKHDIKRIFDPFFTGENGRKVQGSSGVGLYLVKEVCERLNVKIEVKSEIAMGSDFKITYSVKPFNIERLY